VTRVAQDRIGSHGEPRVPAPPVFQGPTSSASPRRIYQLVTGQGLSAGVADQALISVAGFVSTILLARSLTPDEFGAYTLVLAAVLLSNAIQTGLVASPHNIIGATLQGKTYVRFTSTTFAVQGMLSGAAAAIGLAGAAGAALVAPNVAGPILAAGVLLATSSLHNYARRVLYTETRPRSALTTDVLAYGGQIVVFVLLWQSEMLATRSALWALAATSAAGAIVGLMLLRSSIAWQASWTDARDMLQLGRWLAVNQAAAWTTVNLYLFLAAALAGAATTAAVRAAQVVMGPLNVLQAYLPLALIPRFARTLDAGGKSALRRDMGRVFALTAPIFAAYAAFAVIFARDLLHLLYGGGYDRYWPVVALLAGYAFFSYTAEVFASALSASRRTRSIFFAHALAGTFVLSAGWLLIVLLGSTGAALGLLLNSIILNAVLLHHIRRFGRA
jgi:O-antigen/teichoic acid export membrane protein